MDIPESVPDEPYQLLDTTYELLAARNQTLEEIAIDAGLDPSWLAKFHRRAIPKPGVNLVQKLHDYLVRRAASAAANQQGTPSVAADCR